MAGGGGGGLPDESEYPLRGQNRFCCFGALLGLMARFHVRNTAHPTSNSFPADRSKPVLLLQFVPNIFFFWCP